MSRHLLVIVIILLLVATIALCGWFLVKWATDRNGESAGGATPTPAAGGKAGADTRGEPAAATTSCDNLPTQTGVLDRIRARKRIVVGIQKNAPPMNYRVDDAGEVTEEDSGRIVGFDHEMSQLIAANLSLVNPERVEVKEVELYEDLFCLLKRKEANGEYSVDVIMSGIVQDDELSGIEWSEPYYDFGYALIAKKDSNIKGLGDLRGSRVKIGFVKGDATVEEYIKGKLLRAEPVPLEDEDNWLNAINLGTVEAIVYDFPFAVTEVKILNDEKERNVVTDELLEIKKPFLEDSDTQYSIGIPAGNPDLKAKIDAAIQRIRVSPQYAELVRKYFKSEERDLRAPDVPPGAKFYEVARGDSLSKVAERELDDVSRWPELRDLNNIADEHLIFPRQKLIMPADYNP